MCVAARRMNNHISRFVQDDKVRVFVYDVKRDVFGQNAFAGALEEGTIYYVAWANLEAWFNDFAINFDIASFDCILDEMAADVGEPAMKVFVNSAIFD
jgi:hypothetical protein